MKHRFNSQLAKKVVHHVDHNPMNNSPENLMIIDPKTHLKYHKWFKKTFPERHREAAEATLKSVENYKPTMKTTVITSKNVESLLVCYNEGFYF